MQETPIAEICGNFGNSNRGLVQSVQQMAMNFAGMMSAFCERLFWTDFSVLFVRINEKINWQVQDELLELMQIPSLRPERARALYRNGITSLELVTQNSARELVDIFVKADGFVSHRQSNAEDLTVRYSYLYSFAHKVLSEAEALRIKQKFDPDKTAQNYLMQQTHKLLTGSEYMALSDHDSSSEDEGDDASSVSELASDSDSSQITREIDIQDDVREKLVDGCFLSGNNNSDVRIVHSLVHSQ